jgi:catechol 2,3-dioxygenase-like lactoylglutathione lyase family enzyme
LTNIERISNTKEKTLKQSIIHITLLVKEYDEAIDFYIKKLGFDLVEDTPLTEIKRWVLIKPPGSSGCCLLLAKAANEQQFLAVGDQSGGRVFLFLETDNFNESYRSMLATGIIFVREPVEESYGTVAVFADLYGNLWDLIERKTEAI